MLVFGGTSLLLAVVIVAGMMGSEWCSRFTGRRGYVVTSGSMEPAISTGSYVMVRLLGPIAGQSLRIGDVVTFRAPGIPGTVITHRIVGTETSNATSTYTTKGDANATADAVRVPSSDVIGVHDFDVPLLGYAVESMHDPAVSASFIGAFLFASVGIRSGGDGREEEEETTRRQER